MLSIQDIPTLRQQLKKVHDQKIVLVPTMGNLHQGHLELVTRAQSYSKQVIVSIFVNPLQFGPNEDFATYPRTLESDLAKLQALNVPFVFTPRIEDIYPQLDNHTQVAVPKISDDLCGIFRPHFFYGVATIVCKLFNIVQPDIAIFGEKDFQQLHIIKKMVQDLCLPIEIVAAPTVRESDGLAMSSRNQYLSNEFRVQANEIYQTLENIKSQLLTKQNSYAEIISNAISNLENKNFKVDYISIRDKNTLLPAQKEDAELVILIAAWLGSTRLIDNMTVKLC